MKRKNEVFELPIPLGEMDSMLDVFIHSDLDTDESAVALHMAHAINHVDALADALEALLVESQCHAGSLGFYQAQDDAKAALKAYRGEK